MFIHSDLVGASSVVTNASGIVLENTSYAPYGNILYGGTQTRYDYEDKEYNSVVKDYDFNFRKYKPDWAKFTQPDDIIQNVYDPQSLNRYAFERDNPYKYSDPTGHLWDVADVLMAGWDIKTAIQKPSFANIAWATVSIITLAPIIPNVAGYIRYGDRAIDALKTADKAKDAINAAEKAALAADKTKELNNFFKLTSEQGWASVTKMEKGFEIHGKGLNVKTLEKYISRSKSGITLINSTNNTLQDNSIYGTGHAAILVSVSSHNTIAYNSLSNNANAGIVIGDLYYFQTLPSNNNILLNNNISGMSSVLYAGILINVDSQNNSVIGNVITSGTNAGIMLNRANNTVISGNTMSGNPVGLFISDASHNLVWNNIFDSNTHLSAYEEQNATDNSWNLSEVGNFWSDYSPNEGSGTYEIIGTGDGVDYHPTRYVTCGSSITGYTVLHNDIVGCEEYGLIVGSDNTSLDCAGHSIIGDGNAFAGIFFENMQNHYQQLRDKRFPLWSVHLLEFSGTNQHECHP